jgi:hypothetical protein
MSIGATTCAISGNPTVASGMTAYTVSAKSTTATGSTTVSLKVIGRTPTRVYGQYGSFSCAQANRLSGSCAAGSVNADTLSMPIGVHATASGVYVADNANHRVLYYPGTATTATAVYGQFNDLNCGISNRASGSCGAASTSAGSLSFPRRVISDTTGIYIVDESNNRVLYFSGSSTTATGVYGQTDFLTSAAATTQTGLIGNSGGDAITGLAHDGTGLFVFDTARALYYAPSGAVVGPAASRVYGQFGSFTCGVSWNNGGCATTSASASNFHTTAGDLFADASGVYFADTGSNRVLFYSGSGTTAASRVYGQGGNFTSSTANNGGINATALNNPHGVYASDSGVFVADTVNSRVLFYPGSSTSAITVFGQYGDFTCAQANRASGSCSAGSVAADTLNQPKGVFAAADGIYIADTANNRVLFY